MSTLLALNCPQCAAPLPRVARWRTVQCSHCGTTITRSGQALVHRARYRQAWQRECTGHAGAALVWRGRAFVELARLGEGDHADLLLAQRVGGAPWRVIFKQARSSADEPALQAQAAMWAALSESQQPGVAHFMQRLPIVLGRGPLHHEGRVGAALLLRQTPGYWGSAADLLRLRPTGIDARHAVWIWRRLLETLGFMHGAGWAHGDVSPGQVLLHPRDHGVMLVGGSRAHPLAGGAGEAAVARDIAQSAWTVRALLAGDSTEAPGLGPATPPALRALVLECCEDPAQAARQGATALALAVGQAAQTDFGAPRFVPFDPLTA